MRYETVEGKKRIRKNSTKSRKVKAKKQRNSW